MPIAVMAFLSHIDQRNLAAVEKLKFSHLLQTGAVLVHPVLAVQHYRGGDDAGHIRLGGVEISLADAKTAYESGFAVMMGEA